MDSQVESSFSEFFQSLREEAELYVKANKPPVSVLARRLSSSEDPLAAKVQDLERENQRLAARVRQLEAENEKLRTRRDDWEAPLDKHANRLAAALNRLEGKSSPEKRSTDSKLRPRKEKEFEWLARSSRESLPTSMSESLHNGIEIMDLRLSPEKFLSEEDDVFRLKEEVTKHKGFIHHLKRSLQDLLIERLQEREEHMRTKSRLDQLLKSIGAKAGQAGVLQQVSC